MPSSLAAYSSEEMTEDDKLSYKNQLTSNDIMD